MKMNYFAAERTRYLWNSVSDAQLSFGVQFPKRLEFANV